VVCSNFHLQAMITTRRLKTLSSISVQRRLIHAGGVSIALNANKRLVCVGLKHVIRDECRNAAIHINALNSAGRQALRRLSQSPSKSSAGESDLQLCALELPRNYGQSRQLGRVADAVTLVLLEQDRFGRHLWLHAAAALALQRMRNAAEREGVSLEVISAFRSRAYQYQLIARKRARGQSTEEILRASTAPGFSEHHSGCAVDFVDALSQPLTEAFEHSAEYQWLQMNAHRFGFFMSYPPNNIHGVMYEPWHWCFRLQKNSTQLRNHAITARRRRRSVFHLLRPRLS
jgi:zinc D-Ala-D-Ala carboxypeptidase